LFDEQAAAVAAEAVGGDAAAMGHASQRFQGLVDQGAAGAVVQLRDQAKAAAIPLIAGVVQAGVAGIAIHPVSGRRRPTVF